MDLLNLFNLDTLDGRKKAVAFAMELLERMALNPLYENPPTHPPPRAPLTDREIVQRMDPEKTYTALELSELLGISRKSLSARLGRIKGVEVTKNGPRKPAFYRLNTRNAPREMEDKVLAFLKQYGESKIHEIAANIDQDPKSTWKILGRLVKAKKVLINKDSGVNHYSLRPPSRVLKPENGISQPSS